MKTKQLECRVVITHDGPTFQLGMFDPYNSRYEPLGSHPIRDIDKVVGGLRGVPVVDADSIQRNLWWGSIQWVGGSSPSLWDLEIDYQHPSALGHTKIAELCQKPQNVNACACH